METTKGRGGYWIVAGQRYLNKLKAVTEAVKIGHWIHWDFHEKEFSCYNWTQEPAASLEHLYVRRARELRQQYSHITVEFSGGSDSWNMLYSFVRAGIPVDLVVHKYAENTVGHRDDVSAFNRWAEGKFQAWPAFQQLQQLDPTLKWHTWDIVDDIYHSWKHDNYDILLHNELHPGVAVKYPGLSRAHQSIIPTNSSSALLCGVDKPVIEFENNKFYLVFYDYAVAQRGILEKEALGSDENHLLFYWDPDCCDLVAKQAHIVVNFINQNPWALRLLDAKKGMDRDVYNNLINKLIYPDYKPEWTPCKSSSWLAPEHEHWFAKNQNHQATKRWHNIMTEYSKYIEDLVRPTQFSHYIQQDDEFNMLPACPSKRYYLADFQPGKI